VRTAEELYRKFEQVLDATERGVLSPKQIDGLNTTLKQMKALGLDIPLRLMSLIAKFSKGGTSNLPTPRGEMLRSFLDLPLKPSPDDRKSLTPGGLR
jgi:hypothetical protein